MGQPPSVMRKSYRPGVGSTRLYWTCEKGFDDGETSVGPAWIDHLDANGELVRSERVADGQWITRSEAMTLARENDYDLLIEDGLVPSAWEAVGATSGKARNPTHRTLLWLEVAFAVLCAALAIVTVFWTGWVESLTGFDPDHQNGAFEWLIVAGFFTGSGLAGLSARAEWRRLAHDSYVDL